MIADHGRGVMSLEYSAHPSAEDVLARISALAVSRWELGGIAITHRIGELAIGETGFHRGGVVRAPWRRSRPADGWLTKRSCKCQCGSGNNSPMERPMGELS